jgi:hypothetical protein
LKISENLYYHHHYYQIIIIIIINNTSIINSKNISLILERSKQILPSFSGELKYLPGEFVHSTNLLSVNEDKTKGYILDVNGKINSKDGLCIDGDCKTSGIWLFENRETKEIFTLYDWKETSLYDQALPSVEEFRKSNSKLTFCIGGRTNCLEFKLWLESKLG